MGEKIPSDKFFELVTGARVRLIGPPELQNKLDVPKHLLATISPLFRREIESHDKAGMITINIGDVPVRAVEKFLQVAYTNDWEYGSGDVGSATDRLGQIMEILRLGQQFECIDLLSKASSDKLRAVIAEDRKMVDGRLIDELFQQSHTHQCQRLVVDSLVKGRVVYQVRLNRGEFQSWEFEGQMKNNAFRMMLLNVVNPILARGAVTGNGERKKFPDPFNNNLSFSV